MNEKVGLGLSTRSATTFQNFFIGENAPTLERLNKSERVWVSGDHGVGKSHVLKASAHQCDDVLLLSGKTPEISETQEHQVILIDDIDCLVGNEQNEFALFAAYEATNFSKQRWAVTASKPPKSLSFIFADLASRMQLFECIELLPVPAESRTELLKFWAVDRDLTISDDVIRFLLDRIPRTQQSMWEALGNIDRAALLGNREVTIPLVKEVMGFNRA